MVEPSGWQCHHFVSESRFTWMIFCFLHGLELLSASCGFDSRWEHSNGHEPCKKRDNMDCASLLADNSYYLFFYRATPAMKNIVAQSWSEGFSWQDSAFLQISGWGSQEAGRLQTPAGDHPVAAWHWLSGFLSLLGNQQGLLRQCHYGAGSVKRCAEGKGLWADRACPEDVWWVCGKGWKVSRVLH